MEGEDEEKDKIRAEERREELRKRQWSKTRASSPVKQGISDSVNKKGERRRGGRCK